MQQNMIEKKINIYTGTLLIILLFSYVICAIWKSPAVTGESLLDLPASYTIDSEYLYSSGSDISYQQETGEFQIQGDNAQKSVLFILNKSDSWNYLKIDASEMNCKDISMKLTFLFEGQENGQQSVLLKEGKNVFKLQEGLLFDEILLTFMGQNGKNFHVNQFTILETTEEFDWKMFFQDYIMIFFMISFAVYVCTYIWKKSSTAEKWKAVKISHTEKYHTVQDELQELIPKLRLTESTRSGIRTLLFVGIFLFDFYLYKISMRSYYKEALFITGIGLIMIAWLAWQEDRCQRKMNSCMVMVWIVLQVMEIISDIFVPKELRFMGLWQLCVLGSFFGIWAGMKKPEKLLHNFKSAIHVLYTAMVFYCIFFYRYFPESGQRYSGPFHNPNPFSLACLLGIVIAVSDMAGTYKTKKLKCAWFGIETLFGILLIWKSECRTALLALAGFFFLSVVLSLLRWSQGKGKNVRLAVFGGLVMFFFTGLLLGIFVMKYVYNRPIDMTSLDSLTSGRINIWRQYIQKWNILGHTEQVVINGNPTYAHNGLLRCMNYYGIFSGAAYILLTVNCAVRLVYVYICRKVRTGTGILLLGVISSFIIATLFESIEDIPFIWSNWLAFYWIIGILMIEWDIMENKKQEKPCRTS